MANRRMISKDIFFTDRFTDMSVTARMLYVYMILNADDEGMLSNLKQVTFMSGGNKKDVQELINNGYVKKFESGVYAVIHWYLMNRVQPTRRKNTIFSAELEELGKDEVYENCRQYVDKVSTQNSQNQNNQNQNQESQNEYSESQGQRDDAKITQEMVSYLENPEFKKAKDYFAEKIGNIRNPHEYTILNFLLETYGYETLMCCIDITASKGGKTVQYLQRVCESNNVGECRNDVHYGCGITV